MTLHDCYEVVLNDILKKGDSLFTGKYDAKNGSKEFMHGVSAVMEYLAYSVSDKKGTEFSNLFIKNMIESEKKVLTNK